MKELIIITFGLSGIVFFIMSLVVNFKTKILIRKTMQEIDERHERFKKTLNKES